jgi:medium-chain acyl-[acyl-carrier-protein] hydrolase
MSAALRPETMAANRLFARFAADGTATLQLFCFPFAGGGAQLFCDWQAHAPAGVAVTGVRLPGREQRYREPVIDSWPAVLTTLIEGIAPEAGRGAYAFFGHCLGARLSYELIHRLAAIGCRLPELLVVAACRAPGTPSRWPDMHSMDTPMLIERLREMNGVPAEVLANRRLMGLLEPVLRADLRLAETWNPSGGRIGVPILALCGEYDDTDPYEDMLGWQQHTSGEFTIRRFPAGHFTLVLEQPGAVMAAIAERLRAGGAR